MLVVLATHSDVLESTRQQGAVQVLGVAQVPSREGLPRVKDLRCKSSVRRGVLALARNTWSDDTMPGPQRWDIVAASLVLPMVGYCFLPYGVKAGRLSCL